MKILLILFTISISNPISADLKLKIDHHGNVVTPVSLDKNQINFKTVKFDEELKFSSELIKQHLKRVSEIIPINTFVVLYGDKNGIVNELDSTYFFKEISLSHTGEDHHHDPEIFFHDIVEIDISLDKNQESVFILQKGKTALKPLTKLLLD